MIEIRTFDGEPGELARFTVDVWRRTYEGRMPVPLWSEDLFRRELFADDACRDYLLVAYDGAKLVGSHPSKPITIRLHGQELPATWGSFISVDPDYRRRGVALRLQQQWYSRHCQHGAVVNLGFQYIASPHAIGPKFWLQQPGRNPIIRRVGMWVRPLDHAAVAAFAMHRLEAWGTRILSLAQGKPRPPRTLDGIRAYRTEDCHSCLALIDQAGRSADLAYLWTPETLDRQLRFPRLSDTVVLERQGNVAGLVNYSLLEILGRRALVVALLDLVAFGTLLPAQRRRLLAAALGRMADQGAMAAMMLRGSAYGWRELAAAGFLPMPSDHYYIGVRFQQDLRIDRVRRLQVLFR